jgi:cystathionine beta-lyase/cystathionine gamma-synthase
MTNPRAARGVCTRAIHGGPGPDPATGAILTPIHQSTTYVQDAVGVHKGYTYTRSGNPTVAALEQQLGALEDAPPAVSFSTGMAAISALFLSTLSAGDRVIVSDVVYGGTVRLLRRILGRFGVAADFVDSSDPAAVRAAVTPATKLVFIETPANPTLKLTDIAAVAAIAREAGVPLAVDNTFLTPVLQRPLELGAGVSVYSTTKHIEGHNCTVGGALTTRDGELLERFRLAQNTLGAPQSPLESWLTIRGIKTLPLRIRRHSESALEVARWLEAHPAVGRVYYPGLESFAQRALALRQHAGDRGEAAHGGVLSFRLRGGTDAGIALMNSVRLCALAENLGAVETLITHPASMTHAALSRAERAAAGIDDGIVRLSVGLEDTRDIIEDLARALAAAVKGEGDASGNDRAEVRQLGAAV